MEEQESVLNIADLWHAVWIRKFVVLIFVAVAVIVAFCKVQFFTPDTYAADGTLYVNARRSESSTGNLTSSDIVNSRALSSTYIETLKTGSFIKQVCENEALGGKYTIAEIARMISIEQVNTTELLKITVIASTPQAAVEVAQAVMAEAPQKLTEVFSAGTVTEVDGVWGRGMVSKGMLSTLLIGFAIGLVLGVVVVCLLRFFDTRVHKSEDVAKRYNVSILGELEQ